MNHPLNTNRYVELVAQISYALSNINKYIELKLKVTKSNEELEKRIEKLEKEMKEIKLSIVQNI